MGNRYLDPRNRDGLIGWLVFLFLSILLLALGGWVASKVELLDMPQLAKVFKSDKDTVETITGEEVIEILRSKGFQVQVLPSQLDRYENGPEIEESLIFDADNYRIMVIVFTTTKFAKEYSFDEILDEFGISYTFIRINRTVIQVTPGDEDFALILKELIISYQETK